MSDHAAFAAVVAAYERGRWQWALPRGALAAAVAAPSVVVGAAVERTALMALVVAAIAVVAGWRSRGGLLGAWCGAAVAAVPVIVGSVIGDACTCAGGLCFSLCGIGCAAGSALVGSLGGVAFAGLAHGRSDFVAAAVAAGVVGTVACPVVGVGSVVGALVGVAVALPPAFLASRVVRKALA